MLCVEFPQVKLASKLSPCNYSTTQPFVVSSRNAPLWTLKTAVLQTTL